MPALGMPFVLDVLEIDDVFDLLAKTPLGVAAEELRNSPAKVARGGTDLSVLSRQVSGLILRAYLRISSSCCWTG